MIFLPHFEQNSVRLFCSKRYFLYICSKINAKIMAQKIIGRKQEIKELLDLYKENKPVFAVIYGRRRVGKTFLVRELFQDKMSFYHTGLSPYELSGQKIMEQQLASFYSSLVRYGSKSKKVPSSWLEAFDALINLLEEQDADKRQVIFIDELPWLDTPRSGFVTALEHFWNGWASARRDIVLIVCGSATSWMMDKLINNHGGLYGRLTHRLFLQPFSLGESEAFLNTKGMMLSRYELAELYMILGGIPYYLNLLDERLSLAQNIDRLLFNPNGQLYNEFTILYRSLFKDSEAYVKVVECLNERGYGMMRSEIADATGMKSGKSLTTILDNLESCGFIRKYVNYGCSTRKSLYQLVDFFTLFYFRFLRDSSFRNLLYWSKLQRTPRFYAWAGVSFEILAMNHIDQVKQRLGISGVSTQLYSWRSKSDAGAAERAAQIDMVIERGDNTINLCEMKFSESEFAINKDYEKILRNKIVRFMEETKTRKSIQLTFISSYGLQRNMYSGIAQNEVVLNDLF
jgi:AAA+ ATPase superfamily predicted ATPase